MNHLTEFSQVIVKACLELRQTDKTVLSKLTDFSQETLKAQKRITVVFLAEFSQVIENCCLEFRRPDKTVLSKLTDSVKTKVFWSAYKSLCNITYLVTLRHHLTSCMFIEVNT